MLKLNDKGCAIRIGDWKLIDGYPVVEIGMVKIRACMASRLYFGKDVTAYKDLQARAVKLEMVDNMNI